MYKTNLEMLKEEIENSEKSYEEVANYLEIDRATLYRRIKNNTLRICDIQRITEFIGIPVEKACLIFLAE